MSFEITVVALVTDTAGGGAGHGKVIRMALTSGGPDSPLGRPMGPMSADVKLVNRVAVGPSNPPGYGYETRGSLKVPSAVCQMFKETGTLVVTYTYANDVSASACCPGKYDHHLAFNDPKNPKIPAPVRSLVIRY